MTTTNLLSAATIPCLAGGLLFCPPLLLAILPLSVAVMAIDYKKA